MHPVLKTVLGTLFFAVAAVGLGLYVFPERPYLAWGLLFLCWACFRLRLRAVRLFGKQEAASSGSKGGEVRARGAADDAREEAYERWRRGGDDPA